MRLSALAEAYGTPAFILDEADVRYRCRSYVAALPRTEIAYAGTAFLCRAMARWIAAEGLSLAVSSAGELAVAQAVNFPAERIILRGNARTPADLRADLRAALPFGQPGAGGIPRQARRRPAPHPYAPLAPARTAAWAMTFRSLSGRSLSGHHRQRLSPWSVQGHHKAKLKVGTI